MKQWILALCTLLPQLAQAQLPVDQERDAVRRLFSTRFPDVPLSEYQREPASLTTANPVRSDAQLDRMIDRGAKLYAAGLPNGKPYSDCLAPDARAHFPRFNLGLGEVETLTQAVVRCQSRTKDGTWSSESAEIEAYLSHSVQGKPLEVDFPEHDQRATDWYEKGRFLFHAKRGQLNLSCADCHEANAGAHLRAETLGPSLSHSLRFPIYLQGQTKLRSLQEQYQICSLRVRAKPYALQSPEYRALEWYEALMSDGLPLSAPSLEPSMEITAH